jgi:exodeoxyribonuclease VII large subunit
MASRCRGVLGVYPDGVKVEATFHGDRKVFSVSAFNEGIGIYLGRLPALWVEGEVTELRRNDAWAFVFLTLKDPGSGACLRVTMQRRRFDALELELNDGERVLVEGKTEIYPAKGELSFRASTIERIGLGDHLAAIERLKRVLAAEGLFAVERKRRLPRFPRAVGVVTGADAAARGDVVTGIRSRFPAAHIVVAETRVQGAGAGTHIAAALRRVAAHPAVDVIIVARGGGSFDDLLPFNDETVVRAFAACPVPVVSAVGHEQDTPLCDLAADVRASTPTSAARLVVPDLVELKAGLGRLRELLNGSVRRALDRDRERLDRSRDRLRTAPLLLFERRRVALDHAAARLQALSPRATLTRGYAVVRAGGVALRDAAATAPGSPIEIELATGGLTATVEEVLL